MIPVPGGDSVEMAPQTTPAGIGGVGVAAVAVQKDEVSGARDHRAVRMLPCVTRHEGECSLLDVHEQEAVKSFPDEPVAGQIGELSALQRVQKHLHGIFAWGIDEIV